VDELELRLEDPVGVRTDYVLASCDPSLISNVQSTNYNFLCKH
jgi:hypothetical protein